MATLTEKAVVANDAVFIARVKQGIVQAAADVHAESDETAGHGLRAAWASQVLVDPHGWAARVAIAVANNPQIGTTGSNDPADDPDGDGALQFVVNSLVDAFAGV